MDVNAGSESELARDISAAPVSKGRLAYLDAARGVLMLLGIILHASLVYDNTPWKVKDPSGNPAYDWIVFSIHSFRMPAFFWIAGYFAAFNLDRMPSSEFIKQRFERLIVPMLATLSTFGVAEWLITRRLPAGNSSHRGFDVGHLWFLIDLFVFSVLAAAFMHRDALVTRTLRWLTSSMRHPFVLLILLSVCSAGSVIATARIANLLAWDGVIAVGVSNAHQLAFYFPYFFFGMMLFRMAGSIGSLTVISPLWLLPAVAASAWVDSNTGVIQPWSAEILTQSFLTWLSVAAALAFSSRIFAEPHPVRTWLADSSYPIYLSHHCIVVAAAVVLLEVRWPTELKFLTVVVVAFVGSALFAQLVRHINFGRWLFTGRRPTRS